MIDGRPSAVVLAREDERIELTRASRQGVQDQVTATDVELALVYRSGN